MSNHLPQPMKNLTFLSFFFILLIDTSNLFGQNNPLFTLYIIGDVGLMPTDDGPLKLLSKELQNETDQTETAAVFLGDNIYKCGWRLKGKKNNKHFKRDSSIMDSILSVFNGYEGNLYFVPGNHDWAMGNKKGYEVIINGQINIDKLLAAHQLNGGHLPKGGNPGPSIIRLNKERVALVIFDSQWIIQKVVKFNVGKNADARQKTFKSVMVDSLKQLKKEGFRIVLNAHHPLYTVGKHGKHGFFLFRIIKRVRSQNLPSKLYRKYADFLETIIDESGTENYTNMIMAYGHDHNLQYWGGDKSYHHIISGSGSKVTNYAAPKNKYMTGKHNRDDSFELKYPEIENGKTGRRGFFKIEFFDGSFRIHALELGRQLKQVYP